MQLKVLVSAIVGSATVIWGGVHWITGGQLGWDLLKPYSIVVTAVTLLAIVFELFLWRLPLIRSIMVRRPSIAGTWETRLESSYRGPDGRPIVKTVYVVVAQTLTTLNVRMFTDKAHSRSLAGSIRPSDDDALFELAVVYQNFPDIDQRLPGSTGGIHFGSLLIPNVPYHSSVLNGHYWTDRRTEGKLTLERRRGELVSSYSEAQQLFAQEVPSIGSRLKGWLQALH